MLECALPLPSPPDRLQHATATCAAHLDSERRHGGDLPAAVIVSALRDSGLLRAPLAAAGGGDGLASPAAAPLLFATLRRIGAADLSAARLFEGHVNAAILVRLYGTGAQQAGFADRLQNGALAGVWGADGADPLQARFDRDVTLDGGKILASGAGFAEAAIATAQTADGPVMILLDGLPPERVDQSAWTPLGMTGSATGRVDLSGLSLPRDRVLGRPGDFLRQPWFSAGAWRFCAAHLGAAERLIDLFRAHLVERNRLSDPYQLQRVATATAAVTTAALWIGEAARRLADPDADATRTVAFANLARFVTERAALDVIETAERGIGLAAFMTPHPAQRILRDLSTYLRQPVPDLAMADAARAILASDRPTADLWG